MNIFLVIILIYMAWKVDVVCDKLHQHIERYNSNEAEKNREVEDFDEEDFDED